MATCRLPSEIHQCIVDFADAGRVFAVAVVLRGVGSTPRLAGTKAIIDSQGNIWGTIGGGLLESRVQELARESLGNGRPRILDFHFAGPSAVEDAPVCGGSMRILIDPAPARWRDVYAQAATARRQRRRGTLITRVTEASTGEYVTVRWSEGSPADGELRDENTLEEDITPPARLIVVGGGHVGQALAAAASLAGFEITLVEDRRDFADPRLFPQGTTIRCGDIAGELAACETDQYTFIAIVARGHNVDAKALEACIGRPAAYIGMMGSRRKVALMRKDFIETGKATPAQWESVHAPIGLDIGGQSPEEIAVAIVAELISVLRGAYIKRQSP